VFGVTGTNGKTTTAWLIRDMMNLLDVQCAYIGTLGFGAPSFPTERRGLGVESTEELRPLANTTPFAIELNAMLAEAVERGCRAVAMEVSSHALAEQRCDGVEFDVVVFTNLSQDHLDYHGTMGAYLAAKRRLFGLRAPSFPPERRGLGVESAHAVINVGDPTGATLAREVGDNAVRFLEVPKLTSFGDVDPWADIEGCAFEVGLTRIHLVLQSRDDGDHGFFADLGGGYNVQNLIAAVSAVKAAGYPMFEITQAITTLLRPVPGRFEPVPNDSGIGIIVDYAHTPDALDKLLETARPLTKGRIITVFGCGGDRDKSKRPLMAQAAERGSDVVVVTSDNPRNEDPDAIISDILFGLPTPQPPPLEDDGPSRRGGVFVEPDRPRAVALAIKLAEPGDCVIIAGKGHENYQIIGRTRYPMDDRELAREGLRQR
jgi:UDP-N-acetylmuramoyl-L-alanyl-D-glutamate--2,6-diaminopimelate ligase